jgi:hypothetical protein
VYVDEDLTPMRARNSRELRKEEGIHSWTIDGMIHTSVLRNGNEQKAVIDSPEDLILKVGWSEEQIRELGIYFDL